MSIARKLALLSLVTGLGIVLVAAAFLWSERRLLLEERSRAVRQAVEVAAGIAGRYRQLAASGALPEAQAKRKALEALRPLRYDGAEYFWVNDMQPRMLMHPVKRELEGRELGAMVDAQGLRLFSVMADVARASDAGFVDYLWPKPGSDHPVPEVSYVQRIAGWNWIVGSGVHVDSVEAMDAQARRLGEVFSVFKVSPQGSPQGSEPGVGVKRALTPELLAPERLERCNDRRRG